MGFLTFTLLYSGKVTLSNSFGFFIALVPAFLFFTAYMLLLIQWIVMLLTIRAVTTNKGDPEKIKQWSTIIFLGRTLFHTFTHHPLPPTVLACIQYSTLLILCFFSLEIFGVQPPSTVPFTGNIIEALLSGTISVCYTLVSVLFLICGILLIRYVPQKVYSGTALTRNREFRTNLLIQSDSGNQSQVQRRMSSIVIIVPLTFLIRVVFVAFDIVVNLSELWWMDWFYFTVFEWLPLLFLIILSVRSSSDLVRPPRAL